MGEYKIGDALHNFIGNSRLKKGLQAVQIEEAWENIMGKTVSKYTDKIQLVNQTLFINTQVAPLKHELVLQKEKIKERLNEILGNGAVQEVVIR